MSCEFLKAGAALAALLIGLTNEGVAQGLSPWQATVAQEHADRMSRLRRLSEQRLRESPLLFGYAMPKAALPVDFGVAVSVLRAVYGQKVFFDTDQDGLRPEAEAVLDVVAETLRREASDTQVFVAGHADARGGAVHNFALSARRAQNVAWALARRGVAQAKIWWVPFGAAIPLFPNTTDENMARNRRVEFVFGARVEAVALWLSWQRRLICVGATEGERITCLRALDALPRVQAVPISRGETDQPPAAETARLPSIDPATLVPVTPPRQGAAPASDDRAVVPLPKNAPVVIDLSQERVLVDRIYR